MNSSSTIYDIFLSYVPENVSIYRIITYLSYLIFIGLYIYYGIKLTNYSNPFHTKDKNMISYALYITAYVPLFISALSILYMNKLSTYKGFLIKNVLFIGFILTPVLVYRDSILSDDYIEDTPSASELVDLRGVINQEEMDKDKQILKDPLKSDEDKEEASQRIADRLSQRDHNIEIRERAAESEASERSMLDRGIYD